MQILFEPEEYNPQLKKSGGQSGGSSKYNNKVTSSRNSSTKNKLKK